MISNYKSLLRIGDELYEILRTFSIEYFYNKEKLLVNSAIDLWKEHLCADFVVKNTERFLFCKKIDTIEFEMINTDVILAN